MLASTCTLVAHSSASPPQGGVLERGESGVGRGVHEGCWYGGQALLPLQLCNTVQTVFFRRQRCYLHALLQDDLIILLALLQA